MDPEGHYPQNTISHCIISNKHSDHIALFSGLDFCNARDESRFILKSKTGLCLLTLSVFKRFTILVPS